MKLPVQPHAYDRNLEQRRSSEIERALAEVTRSAGFVTIGIGVPAFTPDGRAIYIRQDGGTGTTLYVYEGASWVAK